MKEIQSVLKLVADGLKSLAQCVEAISDKVDELAESQTAEQTKSAAKPEAKEFAPKKKVTRKAAAKAPKKKAARAPTAAETVYKFISTSKNGIDVTTLVKKTGYDRKKLSNAIYRLVKQGKIESIGKGVYVKT